MKAFNKCYKVAISMLWEYVEDEVGGDAGGDRSGNSRKLSRGSDYFQLTTQRMSVYMDQGSLLKK